MSLKRICLTPRLGGIGGMATFQAKLAAGLAQRGVETTLDLKDEPYEAVLVIGGTRHLLDLWRVKQRAIPLIQRLDGMNWIHRVPRRAGMQRLSLKRWLRSEYGNWLLNFIRTRLADRVVYQSAFAQDWWQRVYGSLEKPVRVIHNGVDLNRFTPDGPNNRPTNVFRLLLVEANLAGGYEIGLANAVRLVKYLREHYPQPFELMVVGNVPVDLWTHWQQRTIVRLSFTGAVPHEQIPEIDRSAHLLFSADLNAACPNSVIEALACGLPVLSYDTGALGELVGEAGRLVSYGGDPWRLEPPDIPALAQAAAAIAQDHERYRLAARKRAEEYLGLDLMVERYLEVLGAG